MQLFFKTVVYFLIIFSLTQNIFCQEELITTKFIQDGTLYKNIDKPSQAVAQFKENEKCVVISFLGNYVYKIKYKEWEGFVKDQYLVINEAMMDLYFDHEEKERLKAIKERELRQEKIQKIKQEVEDSIARINEEKERKQNVALQQEIIKQEQIDQKRREDSIVKIKEAERKQVEVLQKQRLLQEQINQKMLEDSIAKVKEAERKQIEALQKERLLQEQINQKRREDSIAKIKEAERKQFEALQKERLLQEQINQKRLEDSIAKIKEAERKQVEALQKQRLLQEQINQKRREDSIAKIKEAERKQVEVLQKQRLLQEQINQKRLEDSIAKVKEDERKQIEALQKERLLQEQINQKRREDSIAKIKEAERKQFEALQKERLLQEQINQKRLEDSIAKIKEAERKQVEALQKQRLLQEQINQKRLDDSIAKINAESIKDTNSLERNESLNTCKYLINKYDEYYKQMVIITDKYEINPNLNIELIREGNSSKININLSEDLGCVSYVPATRSTVRVTLENNQVIIFYHSGSLDCTDFSLKALLPESKIKQLKQSAIKSFTLKGTKGTVTISDIDYRDFFIDKLKCIE